MYPYIGAKIVSNNIMMLCPRAAIDNKRGNVFSSLFVRGLSALSDVSIRQFDHILITPTIKCASLTRLKEEHTIDFI